MINGLLQPFIDLGYSDRGPLFAIGIHHYWDAFENPDLPPFMLQRTLPKAFRTNALTEIGCRDYVVENPSDIPRHLRTDRWQQLCTALDNWDALPGLVQWRLIALLHALCFYPLVKKLVSEIRNDAVLSDPALAELIYLRASASYVYDMPSRVADYKNADLSAFVWIAQTQGVAPQTGYNAAIKVLTHQAKNGAATDELRVWNDLAAEHLGRLQDAGSEFDYVLCQSRFHRAAAFLPMRSGDRDEMIRVMDLAEEYANALAPATEAQDVLRRENLHPLLESRTKEALWLGDLDSALVRATQVTELDPFEARGWLELGEVLMARRDWAKALDAYATAALIGPPASAIARHMAGLCLEKLGGTAASALMFKSAIDIDPGAVATRNKVQKLPETEVFDALKQWNLQTMMF